MADAFDLLEVLDTGFAHGFDRAEVVEQPLLVAFADAGNLVERAAQGAFAPLLAVVGDGEAVGFVAYTLQQIHAFGLAFEDDRIVVVRHPHLFQAFGQSADGHVVHATVLKRLGGGFR